VTVRAEYPHDPDAFTQGLLVDGDRLFESTGLHGRSSVREVEIATGKVLRRQDLPSRLFGEGLAEVGERLIQLTWQSGLALIWDRDRFTREGELSYSGEGWGLTWDGERLIMSDGSSWLLFRDPRTFDELGRVQVTLNGRPLPRLNELEWVDGAVWANVWQSESIVRIDPTTGEVTGVADCSGLESRLPPGSSATIDVLNGIAYWPAHHTFLVTGKLWPKLFEVSFDEP
jgi:glutamine cyclotransferase